MVSVSGGYFTGIGNVNNYTSFCLKILQIEGIS